MRGRFGVEGFQRGQQEALTIAKINTLSLWIWLVVSILGLLITRDDPRGYPIYLGNAWGNMFLTCNRNSTEPLCEQRQSLEPGSLAMFTRHGGSNYPTKESGKACFSKDMQTNLDGGCGDLVAAVGRCDEVCVGGLCGTPAGVQSGQGSSNVVYVHLREYLGDDASTTLQMILISFAGCCCVVMIIVGWLVVKRLNGAPSGSVGKGESQSDEETAVEEE